MNINPPRLKREALAQLSVIIKLSDPWEIGEFLGWKELEGVILDVDIRTDKHYGKKQEQAIIKLNNSFEYRNVNCEYFIVSPRLEGESFNSLISRKSVFCNLTRIPQDAANSKDPFDLSWWRGGVAAIAVLAAKQT